ncbi:hypothetical protein L9F63_008566, partial [Diploptera punctata]
MLSEEEEDVVSTEVDFEPFSDTCGEGDESDLEGLDLTLFEPATGSAAGRLVPCCPHCCGHCATEVARRNGALPGTLYLLTSPPEQVSGFLRDKIRLKNHIPIARFLCPAAWYLSGQQLTVSVIPPTLVGKLGSFV